MPLPSRILMGTLPPEVQKTVLSFVPAHGADPDSLRRCWENLPVYFSFVLRFKMEIAYLDWRSSLSVQDGAQGSTVGGQSPVGDNEGEDEA